LQILSIGKKDELLEGQCKDLRLPRLFVQIDPFIDRMRGLMAAQEKRTPAPLTDPELTRLGNRLKQACSSLCEVGLPDTLGHLDFNPGNIFILPGRSVFLDWAEGCVTSPLITFEYLREHLQRNRINDAQAIESIVTAYVRPWQSIFSADTLERATMISALVAVFVYAVGANTWHSSEALLKPSVAGYFRSLTRRMYREAVQIAKRREQCLA
jgi:Ser/Thr protein kinase RdoA (MazF antagonist)